VEKRFPYYSPCSFERSVSTYFTTQYLRWFKSDIWLTPNHGWLAVVSFLVLGYTSEPSVPRFSPRVVISESGGGYRRYSQLCK
ncbi:MAG: hypothetical protein ACKPIF_27225, partial [Microcystis panniformis]